MKGVDGVIGVSEEDSAQMVAEGVNEIRADLTKTNDNVSVSEIKSSGDAMKQVVRYKDNIERVPEIKNDNKTNLMNIKVKEKGIQVGSMRVANMEGSNVLGTLEKEYNMKVKRIDNEKTKLEEITPIESKEYAINIDTDTRLTDLEQAGVERLAKLERLAEKDRQAKIKRREELDRVARLQRILALVRAPELDSVAKTKQVDSEQEKEIKRNEDVNVLKDLGNTQIPSVDNKQVNKVETVVDEALNRKKPVKYEGIAKLEHMTKIERISEIDRLVNLELQAEAKRKTDIEHAAKLERDAEFERERKMKYIRELDLKAELEKAEKERLAEKERQEKMKRKVELDRIAKLQRVLVMVRASETDDTAEMKQSEIEQAAELKRQKEIKLLEELGILPRYESAENNTAKFEPLEKENHDSEVDIDFAKMVKLVTDVKEATPILEIGHVEPEADTEHSSQKESEPIREIIADTQKEHNQSPATEYQKTRQKRREELERVKKLQRIIATVRNAEPNGVTHVKLDVETDKKAADLKRKEEKQLLEDLGILPKKHVTQKESGTDLPVEESTVQPNNLNSVKEPVSEPNVKQVAEVKADVKISTEPNAHQIEKRAEIEVQKAVQSEIEAKIKRAAEMERQAKAAREARIKRREELNRMANLQRVVALVPNEEFDDLANMKQTEENKRKEDLKILEVLGIVPKMELSTDNDINPNEVDKKEDVKIMGNETLKREGNIEVHSTNAEKVTDYIVNMETLIEAERNIVRQDVERRIAELRIAQMRRVAELGREMKQVAMTDEGTLKENVAMEIIKTEINNKDTTLNETKQIIQTKHKNKDNIEVKRKTETQLGLSLTDVEDISGIKRKDSNHHFNSENERIIDSAKETNKEKTNLFVDFKTPEVQQDNSEVITSENDKSMAVPFLVVKRELEMNVNEKRINEKMVGMERVRRLDCEWDGQMIARERL